jgi:hypothetical protein
MQEEHTDEIIASSKNSRQRALENTFLFRFAG